MNSTKVYRQLQELREHGAAVESMRMSEATMRKLTEDCFVFEFPETEARPMEVFGISCIQEDRLPLGEIRIATSQGIEAITTNVAA